MPDIGGYIWWKSGGIDRTLKRASDKEHSRVADLQRVSAAKSALEADFAENKITFHALNQEETEALFLKWLDSFVPRMNKKTLKKLGIYGGEKGGDHLWALFEDEHLASEPQGRAARCYSQKPKENCYVLLEYEQLAYKIQNAHNLDTSLLDKYGDIFVFDTDFTWVYCNTNYKEYGPYFHDKTTP